MESPPGYEQFCDDLWTLLSTYPPPFIYIQDIESTQTAFSVVQELLQSLSNTALSTKVHYARVDAISCFTPRLIFETIIHSLVGWESRWEDGCAIWSPGQESRERRGDENEGENNVRVELRWNENLDTFLHGLRSAHAHLSKQAVSKSRNRKGKRKGKGKEGIQAECDNVRFVIVVERPERLKEVHPELMVPFTRLAELVRFFSIGLG